jgi:hypothetical protein
LCFFSASLGNQQGQLFAYLLQIPGGNTGLEALLEIPELGVVALDERTELMFRTEALEPVKERLDLLSFFLQKFFQDKVCAKIVLPLVSCLFQLELIRFEFAQLLAFVRYMTNRYAPRTAM